MTMHDPATDTRLEEVPCVSVWTSDHVGRRLVDAMRTLDRLPRMKGPRQAGNHWPATRVEWADHLAQAELPQAERLEREARHNSLALRPSGQEIDRMDRTTSRRC